ncbi:hypothetical protein B1H58_20385 (plasmid) [Pantoea alhagi]|uniref:Sugar ABC transporter n=1 Tax=Pantoea alhagi TaxID=1891675 RepID=A0A1W6BBE0_9GAMM|nr:hypothetical protein [Pantoea alhagi]ARJ44381.1 hypothetical protein B1H58_20385 [Pantoea alhagi]
MIYTVHCDYKDTVSEKDWNEFYSLNKLPCLISTTGFKTSQRFKSLKSATPRYLAVHTIENIGVIMSKEYLKNGGGTFSHWQKNILNWHRNVYNCQTFAPEVTENEILILSRIELYHLQSEQGYIPFPLQLTGLDKSHFYEIGYVLPRAFLNYFDNLDEVDTYEPITLQLKNT